MKCFFKNMFLLFMFIVNRSVKIFFICIKVLCVIFSVLKYIIENGLFVFIINYIYC